MSALTQALSNPSIASPSPSNTDLDRATPSAELIKRWKKSKESAEAAERSNSPTFIIGSASSYDAADEEMKRVHLLRSRQAGRRGNTDKNTHKTSTLLLKKKLVGAEAADQGEDPEVAEAFAAGMSI